MPPAPDDPEPNPAPRPDPPGHTPARRADLDKIFGDVLPDTTSDEREPDPSTPDEWYHHNRPPHHDR